MRFFLTRLSLGLGGYPSPPSLVAILPPSLCPSLGETPAALAQHSEASSLQVWEVGGLSPGPSTSALCALLGAPHGELSEVTGEGTAGPRVLPRFQSQHHTGSPGALEEALELCSLLPAVCQSVSLSVS